MKKQEIIKKYIYCYIEYYVKTGYKERSINEHSILLKEYKKAKQEIEKTIKHYEFALLNKIIDYEFFKEYESFKTNDKKLLITALDYIFNFIDLESRVLNTFNNIINN